MGRIQLRSVSKQFGANHAIDSVSLDVADGEFLVLLGPSGCGKSTLLRMIAGLEAPTSGRVVLDGRDITSAPPRDRDLAMVFQSYALYPHLSVARNIGFPLRSRKWSKAAVEESVGRVSSLLELGAVLDRRPSQLSGGQRQRVALARAMVREPGAFLMDEPLSNLDAKLRSATRTELIDLHRRLGTTFLYVTHDQVEAMTMATRIALMNAGRIEQVGTPTELYDTPHSTFVAGFLGAPPMNLFDATIVDSAGEVHVSAPGVHIGLGIAADADLRQTVTAGIRPEKMRISSTDGAIAAKVTMVENLGSDELVHALAGTTPLCARGPRPVSVTSGDEVRFHVEPCDVHLFDRESGRALVWDAAASPTLSHV